MGTRVFLRVVTRPLPATDPARSALMSRVRQRGTAPELAVRRILSDMGIRYRLNVRGLPGSPDIGNKGAAKAIFVHGCFWHRHPGCGRTTSPKRNRAFWQKKFARNVERDAQNLASLRQLGYDVLVVWECELDHAAALRRRLSRFWNRGIA